MCKLKYSLKDHLNLIIIIAILTLFYISQDIYKWSIIKWLGAQGSSLYADTFTVLYYSECYKKIGDEVYSSNSICQNWTYGSSILRLINLAGLTTSQTQLIGHLFTYLTVTTFVIHLLFFKFRKSLLVITFLGFISPPVWLLFERANFDALIYLMVFVSALIYAKGKHLLSLLLLLLASISKFYVLPILLILGLLTNKFKTQILSVIIFVLGIFIVVHDLMKIEGNIVQAGNNHFGMKIIGNYLGKIGLQLELYWAYLLGLFLFLLCTKLLLKLDGRYKLIHWNNSTIPALWHYPMFFLSSVHLFCFVIGLNADYRLIFYISSAPYLLIFLSSKARTIFSIVFLISVWFVYPVGYYQTLGDLALEIFTALQFIIVLKFFGYNFFSKYEFKLRWKYNLKT